MTLLEAIIRNGSERIKQHVDDLYIALLSEAKNRKSELEDMKAKADVVMGFLKSYDIPLRYFPNHALKVHGGYDALSKMSDTPVDELMKILPGWADYVTQKEILDQILSEDPIISNGSEQLISLRKSLSGQHTVYPDTEYLLDMYVLALKNEYEHAYYSDEQISSLSDIDLTGLGHPTKDASLQSEMPCFALTLCRISFRYDLLSDIAGIMNLPKRSRTSDSIKAAKMLLRNGRLTEGFKKDTELIETFPYKDHPFYTVYRQFLPNERISDLFMAVKRLQ